MSDEDLMRASEQATVAAWHVERDKGGVLFRWSDDPLDFLWQTEAQARDLMQRLASALD